jgi:hypothetical protein
LFLSSPVVIITHQAVKTGEFSPSCFKKYVWCLFIFYFYALLMGTFMLPLRFSLKNIWWLFHALFYIYFLLLWTFKLSMCLWLYFSWLHYFHIYMYIYAYCLIKNSFVGPTVMYAIYLKFQMDVFMSKIINMPWVHLPWSCMFSIQYSPFRTAFLW